MRDFTLHTYEQLLRAFLTAGYTVFACEDFFSRSTGEPLPERYLILRHDVDARPYYSVRTAQIEHSLGIRATYYFRRYEGRKDEAAFIRQIAALGHEIGYHYEDMSVCQGDAPAAYAHFERSLAYLRTFYPVRTICMHGAPTSKWDGKALWQHYSYRDSGIIAEPYFDTPFDAVFYLTDTGRCWDGARFSVRDKVDSALQSRWAAQGHVYHSSFDIISALQSRAFPSAAMITTHPQRWTDSLLPWLSEAVLQTFKNAVKRLLVR